MKFAYTMYSSYLILTIMRH